MGSVPLLNSRRTRGIAHLMIRAFARDLTLALRIPTDRAIIARMLPEELKLVNPGESNQNVLS